MKPKGEDFVLLAVELARLRIDVLEHHHEVLVAQTHDRRTVQHQVVDVDLRLLVSEEVDGVEDTNGDDGGDEDDGADEAEPGDCFVVAADEERGLDSEHVEGWSEIVPRPLLVTSFDVNLIQSY